MHTAKVEDERQRSKKWLFPMVPEEGLTCLVCFPFFAFFFPPSPFSFFLSPSPDFYCVHRSGNRAARADKRDDSASGLAGVVLDRSSLPRKGNAGKLVEAIVSAVDCFSGRMSSHLLVVLFVLTLIAYRYSHLISRTIESPLFSSLPLSLSFCWRK